MSHANNQEKQKPVEKKVENKPEPDTDFNGKKFLRENFGLGDFDFDDDDDNE